MLARCTVPMSSLLKARPRLQLINHPMLSVKTGQIVAHLTVDLRLALPISELYRLFLERHPTEKKHIEDIAAKRVVDAAATNELARNMESGLVASTNMNALHSMGTREDESRLYNELEIIIHRAHGLPLSSDDNAPTAYVHFQLLGHPDKLTNPVPTSTEPEFNEKFTFPMVTTDQQLRLLQRSKLQLSIIDMKGEELEMKNDGLIGELFVALAALAEGSHIHDTFNVKDVDGKRVGELFITLKWKYSLKKERDLGPRALSGIEVEILLSAFSPGDFHEGVIDYGSFCRFMDPPVQVVHAMEKLRAFCNDMMEREGQTAREVFTLLLDKDDERPPIDEDFFIQRLLRTQVDCLPEDFSKLFQHIDSSQEGKITLDKLLAVLNLDEIANIPTVLQNKLRERARDLSNRGIPAMRLFKEADQWGADGMVTRMEFKNVLKRMGFSLPDEPDPLHSYVGDDPDFKRSQPHTRSQRTGEDDKNEGDILNDTIGSEDNILPQSEGAGGGVSAASAAQVTMKEQRELFEARRSDLQQRSQDALSKEQQLQADRGAFDPDHPMDLAQRLDPYSGGSEHRVSVANRDTGKGPSIDRVSSDAYATKLQSRYRGYQVRKSLSGSATAPLITQSGGTTSPRPDVSETEAIEIQSNTLSAQANILSVENVLRESKLNLIGENQPLPDLASGFLRVDQKRSGLVNRKQFAHVLQQYPAVQLYGAELRAAMDFFDVAMDGNGIDYNAFLRFFRYQAPPLLPAIQKLQSMSLRKNAIGVFRACDPTGQGFIKRVEMMRCLKDLGLGFTSQSVMQTMLQLFETRQDGLVNYLNFFEYVRESELSQSLEVLSMHMYQLFTKHGEKGEAAIREWFGKIDKNNAGKFSIQQLLSFLGEHDIEAPKEAVAALYGELDQDGRGVQFSVFSKWLQDFVQTHNKATDELAMYSTLNLAEIQRKAYTFVLAIARSASGNVEDLMESYLVYDWRRTDSGALAKPLFIRATRRVGFPFTMNELRMLASEFSLSNNGEVITYRKFLEFCTPSNRTAATIVFADQNDQVSTIVTEAQEDEAARQHSAGSVIRFLERALERGIDLLTVFGRYDSISVGRITGSEFCAALADLGLSSVNVKEATEVADRFRASAGEFILYRRIVTELLRHADEATGAADVDPVDVVRAALQLSRVDVSRLREVFEHYDRRGRGDVRVEDLGSIFDEARLRIKRFEIDIIAEKYALGDSAWVGYRPLLKQLELKLGDRKSLTKRLSAVPDEVSTKMKALLETLIIRGKDYRAELDRFDDSYSGTILQADFKAILEERFNAGFTNKEIASLVQAYRSDEDPRRLNYVKMIHHLHPRNFGRVTFEVEEGSSSSSGQEPYQWAESLRQKIRRRCDYAVPGELRRPFRHFARREGIRTVSRDDFSQALRNLGMRLASDQEKALFDMINLCSTAEAFGYNDFVVFVNDPQHSDVIWKLRRAIARGRVSEKEIINALNEQDTNTSGLITAKQFMRAVGSCGIDLSDTDAIRLMARFDSEDNQRFDIDKFFRFLRGKTVDEDDLNELNEFDMAVTRRISIEDAEQLRSSRRRKPDESIELHAWTSLKRRVEEKLDAGYTGNEVFGIFDAEDKGVLDVASLHKGSQKLGLVLTTAEAQSILRRMTVLAGATSVTNATFYDSLGIDLREFAARQEELVGNTRGRRPRRGDRDLDDLGRYKDDLRDDDLSPRGRSAGTGRYNSALELILSRIKGQVLPHR